MSVLIETRSGCERVWLDWSRCSPIGHWAGDTSSPSVVVVSLLLSSGVLLVRLRLRRHHARVRPGPCLKHGNGTGLLRVCLNQRGHCFVARST